MKNSSRREFLTSSAGAAVVATLSCSGVPTEVVGHDAATEHGRDLAVVDASVDVLDATVDQPPLPDLGPDFFTPPCIDPGPGAPQCEVTAAGVAVGRPCDYSAYRLHATPGTTVLDAALVGRDAGGIYARGGVCTHQFCILSLPQAMVATGIACPCHGSQFDHYGRVLSGLAPTDLRSLKISLRCDGQLVVDLATDVSPDFRLEV